MQAKGASMQLLLQKEPSYRTPPASPDAVRLPFIKWGVGRDPRRQEDPSINNSPLPGKPGAGDAVSAGSASAILDLRSIGFWLSLLLGAPVTHKAVTVQPKNVTGVTVNYAETACPSGAGTLSFTASGKALTWAAQGDSGPGAAVDVSAGGYFLLPSGTAGKGLHVTVSASALPAADKADADVAVSATLKAHVFPITLDERMSALAELGHSDIGKYYRTSGVKLNKLSFDVSALQQNIDLELIGGEETESDIAWDAAPTAYNSVRACGSGGYISNGVDATLGSLTGGSLTVENGMEGKELIDGREGYGLVTQGDVKISGSVKAVFDSQGAFALARAGTSTRLRVGSSAVVGADTFALWWDMPHVDFGDKPMTKEGKSGLFVDTDWTAHSVASGELPLVLLINDVPAYFG